MRSVTDFWDHDFVDKIGLMHPGLWFGLSSGSDEPELDHNMLPQGELKMHFAGGVSLAAHFWSAGWEASAPRSSVRRLLREMPPNNIWRVATRAAR